MPKNSLKNVIARRKLAGTVDPYMDTLIRATVENLVNSYLPILAEEIMSKAEEFVAEVINDKVKKKVKGEKGEQGLRGFPGIDGETPTDEQIVSLIKPLIPEPIKGERGEQGKQGIPGIGVEGKPGKPGKDGSPDKPNEIVAKINSASAKIRMSAIAGMREALQRAVREGRGGGKSGGGGMGNVQHESKSVSSATTQVTTNYPIAGGGYAIWGFYQGGNIVRGTDYTVSSDRKTIPLLFTPQDNTNIDLIYIRG